MGFLDQLRRARGDRPPPARFVFVAPDQLSRAIGPLRDADPRDLGVLLVENAWKARRRPYHRQKLALVLANQRHFALECARAGLFVEVRFGDAPYRELLDEAVRALGPLVMMEAAERELRVDLAPLVEDGRIRVIPHEGFLTTREDFLRFAGRRAPWRMDRFYRGVRRATGILMDGPEPEGGRFSFDVENREPWRGDPPAPPALTFPIDDVKREVHDLVDARFAAHPGQVTLDALPATLDDAEALWTHAKAHALPSFGPYEDAMSTTSSTLFHTRVSPLLNLHRLLPRRVVDEAARLPLPIASREGFVRQILGWREFVRHVHRETDGFRTVVDDGARDAPGDGGYRAWRGAPFPGGAPDALVDGGAALHGLEASPLDVPPAFWGAPSGLACLDHTVASVWREGWSHHITRLMVLSNIATLLGVDARGLTDWFWVAYVDAFDWVVEPNVLAMGTFAAGPLMTTKPYVAGSGYIDRMSDHCASCAFSAKRDCPLPALYWAFLDRHAEKLAANPRLKLPYASLRRRSDAQRAHDAQVFADVRATLARGERLVPLGRAGRAARARR